MRAHARRTIHTLIAIVVATTACQNPVPGFGSSPSAASRNADGLLGAVARRFGPVRRSPHLTAIRPQLLRQALTPAALYADEAMWTSVDGATKTLTVVGSARESGYILATNSIGPAPRRIGDARHIIQLRALDDGAWEWMRRDELAIGPVTPDRIPTVLQATLAALEHRSEREIRLGYELGLPHTTRVLSRLFALDSIRPRSLDDGSTRLTIAARLRSDHARREYPHLAKYLARYLSPARYHLTLVDADARRWLEIDARNEQIVIHLRSRDGILLPLDGGSASMPDSLRMQLDLSARITMFRVGVEALVGDVVFLREPERRGFEIRFAEEPDWHFPLAVQGLMRGSLSRPFEGEGATVRVAAAAAPGQTLLTRELRVAVQENAMLRWMNGLGSRVMEDYSGSVEEEASQFTGDVFRTLQREVVSLIRSEQRYSTAP